MAWKKRLAWAVVFAVGLFAPAKAPSAQPLTPLADYLSLPAERRAAPYPMIRCAGLHFGLLDYGGASFPPDVLRRSQEAVTLLVRAAVVIRTTETGGEHEGHLRAVMGSVNHIAAIYRTRVQANFDRTGEAWGNDALVQSDLMTCRSIVDTVGDALPQLRP